MADLDDAVDESQQERQAQRIFDRDAAAIASNLTNSSGIIAAARADAGDTTSSLAVTTTQCTCPGGTPLCSTATTCTGSTVSGTYVKVAVSESLSMLINYPFLTSPFTVTGQAMVRVQ